MSIARHGWGVRAAITAFASQVHPVFMLPPLATALFGAVLAGRWGATALDPTVAAWHLVAVFTALYTAHVVDGYVDFYRRDEDDDHPLTATGCRVALVAASAGFFVATAALWLLVDIGAVALVLPGWLVAINHAPQLDTSPMGATLGYPLGVSLALLGGFYVQAGGLGFTPLALAAVFLVVLAGIKIIDDAQDTVYDAGIGKRTVAVVLGPMRARLLAYGLMAVGSVAVVVLALGTSGLPPSGAMAVVPFGVVAVLAWRAGPELATMLLIRGAYLFLAVLLAAVWFRPLV